ERVNGFRPYRAGSLFAPFSLDPHVPWTTEAHVVYIQVHQLLGSHARVVEQSDQRVIALSKRRPMIDLGEDFEDFFAFKVFGHMLCVALEANRKNGVGLGQTA